MRAAAVLLLLLGLAVGGLGLYFGLSTVSRDGVLCGTGFTGMTSAVAQERTAAKPSPNLHPIKTECAPALSSRRTLGLALGIPGGALALGCAIALLTTVDTSVQVGEPRPEHV